MNNNRNKIWQQIRDLLSTWGIFTVLVVAAFVFAYQFVKPAPPDTIVMATGEAGGAYQAFGEQFAAYLAEEGIEVSLRPTAGSVENLQLLEALDDVDIAFVQGGLAGIVPTNNVVALGSLYLEPLWVVVRGDLAIDGIQDLAGLRLAVGAEGSGTRAVVMTLLDANNIGAEDADFLEVPLAELPQGLRDGSIDVAFVIAAASSDRVRELVEIPGVHLRGLDRTDAYVRRFPYLSKVRIPEGVLDLRANFPAADVETVALTAMLATNTKLHPALADLLLVAAREIHGKHSLLADAGEFPTSRFIDLPLNEEAERHFRYGPPFLMRYLPFWAATFVDRLWVMILPLIGLAIPLIKLVPPAYRWQIRRRMLRVYAELQRIDPARSPIADEKDRAERLELLQRLENHPKLESVPHEYTDDVYKLQRDIDLVRRKLNRSVHPA